MKKPTFYKVIVFIFIGTLVVQLLLNTYTKFLKPHGSVLDQYTTSVESAVVHNVPFEQLVRDYATTQKELQNFEKNADSLRQADKYPYERIAALTTQKEKLEEAIREREEADIQPKKMIFYWIAGIILVAVGVVSYRKLSQWIGVTLCFLGFALSIWWASPAPRLLVSNRITMQQQDTLLTLEIIFSLLTLLFCIIAWVRFERAQEKTEAGIPQASV